MARLHTVGFETQAQSTTAQQHGESDNGAQTPQSQQVGTPTFDTTNERSGAACYSCAASSSYLRLTGNGIYGTLDRTYWTRVAVRFPDATPSSNIIFWRLQISTVDTVTARLNTTGTAIVLDSNNAQIGSATGTLSDNTWYVFEFETMIPTASNGTVAMNLDGTEIVRSTAVDVNNSVTSPRAHIGNTAATASVTVLVDDIAINDNQGASQNTFPGSGKIILLKAIGDSAKGTGWKQPGGDTTDIYDSVDNTPPACDVTPAAAADVAGNALKYATNNTNLGSTSNYDVNCATYTTGGVGSSDTVLVTQALIRATTDSTTGTNNFGINQVSNPTGGSSTGLNLETTAAGGAEPTGWKSYRTIPTYGGSPTLGTSPVVRIARTELSQTRYHSTDLMGLLVEYLPAAGPTPQDVDLGQADALSAATLAITATTGVPLGSSPAQSDATLALAAPTQVALGSSPAQSDATLAMFTPRTVALDSSPAQSAATLVLSAPTQIPLGSSPALTGATLALSAQTTVALGSSPALSAATLALAAPTQVPLQSSPAQSAATIAITAPTAVPLGSSPAVCAATLALVVPRTVALGQCDALSGVGSFFHLDAYEAYSDTVQASSPTFYWKFDEPDVARDHGFFGDTTGVRSFDGTYVNSPTLAAGALRQAATSTGVTFSSASSQRVSANIGGFGSSLDTATVTFWVKTTTTTSSYILGYANTGSGTNRGGLAIAANQNAAGTTTTGATRFSVTDNTNTAMQCHITTNIYDGSWHHIVAVVGASGWEIHVDGVGVTELSPSGTPGTYADANVDLDIGALNFLGTHTGYFTGSVDELAIFNTRFTGFGPAVLYLTNFHNVGLGTAAAQSAATATIYAPRIVPLDTAACSSSATLALSAPTQIPLGICAASSTVTLTLAAPTQVPLASSPATSSATLALAAKPAIPLGSSPAQSAATLTLTAPTQTPLASSVSVSTATLALRVPAGIPLGTSPASASATLALTAPTQVVLGTAAGQSAATAVVIVGANTVPLQSSAAQSAATLALLAKTGIPLGASAAQAAATLSVTAKTQVMLASSPATSSASISLVTSLTLTLGPAAGQSATTISFSYGVTFELDTAGQSSATLSIHTPTPAVAVVLDLSALHPDPALYPADDLVPYIGARATSSATLALGISGVAEQVGALHLLVDSVTRSLGIDPHGRGLVADSRVTTLDVDSATRTLTLDEKERQLVADPHDRDLEVEGDTRTLEVDV